MRAALIYATVLLAGAAINRGVLNPHMPWRDFVGAYVAGCVFGGILVLSFRAIRALWRVR